MNDLRITQEVIPEIWAGLQSRAGKDPAAVDLKIAVYKAHPYLDTFRIEHLCDAWLARRKRNESS